MNELVQIEVRSGAAHLFLEKRMRWKKPVAGCMVYEYECRMRFVNVTDKNFEDIFMVSAKFEQWEYVKHHIFDMVKNYVAIVNEQYLPIPFLVYENDCIIGFVQVNYYDKNSVFDICKIIVHETEQNKGYGTKILFNPIVIYLKKKLRLLMPCVMVKKLLD